MTWLDGLVLLALPLPLLAGMASWVQRHREEGQKAALLWTLGLGTLALGLPWLAFFLGLRHDLTGTPTFWERCVQFQHACIRWAHHTLQQSGHLQTLLLAAAGLWALAGGLRIARAYLRARRLLRRAHPFPLESFPKLQRALQRVQEKTGLASLPPVYERVTPQADAALFGLWNPVLLLSRRLVVTLSEEELEAVLLHELGHRRFHDGLWNLLALFFHYWWAPVPLMRPLYRAFVEAMERQADRWTLQHLPSPLPLAEALVKVASSGPPRDPDLQVQGLAEASTPLARRLQHLLEPPRRFPWGRFAFLWALLLALLFTAGYGWSNAHPRWSAPGMACGPRTALHTFHPHG